MIWGPARGAVLLATLLALAGCWTAPVANVQPKGDARLIQDAIVVESLKSATVLNATRRTVVVSIPGDPAAVTYRIGAEVRSLDRIKVGDEVRAMIAEGLAAYVLRDGRLPVPDGVPEVIATNARVLSVDRSYRLLTLQFPNGQTETLKVGRQVRLDEMEAGDAVVIRPVRVVSLRVRK